MLVFLSGRGRWWPAWGRLSCVWMATTTIQLCGRYVAELDGERVEVRLPGRQGRLLFAYLVLHRDRGVGRSELVEAIWPGDLPHDPEDALAALLSKVRSGLGRDWIEGRREVQLALPAG